ncbi:type 1 glutamine amidotransferase [Silvibacterium sp.]|uniref:type 1 glutamine amidotransferase n=1 Tax=Silvibacterium sp. TaxID=1964179 RepID=UPI0039E4362D
MPKRWAILQHVEFEGPGLLLAEIERRGLIAEIVRLDRNEPLPAASALDGLIVMGGPMGVYEQERYPHIASEIALLREVIAANKPVLGVCLGSQLLAAALGARVYPGAPGQEIGFDAVQLTAEGAQDAVFASAPSPLPVFHWHGDTFDLPAGATLLASSDLYPHQAFRYGSNVYGLQFHVEPSATTWTDWQPHLAADRFPRSEQQRLLEGTGRALIQRLFDVFAER